MKRFLRVVLTLALLAPVAAQAQIYLPYNEPFSAISTPLPADATPLTSPSTGLVAELPSSNWIFRDGNANLAVTSGRSGRFYDTLSSALVTSGAAPTNANAIRITHDPNYGAELAVNGTFTGDATGWTLDPVWSHSNDSVSVNGNGAITNTATATNGSIYNITFTISNYVAGTVQPSFGGVTYPAKSGNGTFSGNVKATGTGALILTAAGTANLTIDNVTVREVQGSFTQNLCGPTITLKSDAAGALVRDYTASLKFAVLEPTTGNDFRIGVHFIGVNGNQSTNALYLKIGQGDIYPGNTQDLEALAGATGIATSTAPIPWGDSRLDNTDYVVNKWYNAEWTISTNATAGVGKARLRIDGKRFPRDWALAAMAATPATTVRFATQGYHNSDGSVLIDDLKFVAGHTSYPEVQVMDGAANVTTSTYDAATGENIPSTVDFGTVSEGATSEKTLTINNIGPAVLTTADLNVSGDFAVKSGEVLEGSIAATSGTDTIVIEMNTSAPGAKTGTLTFTTNDMDVKINLSGTVNALTPAELDVFEADGTTAIAHNAMLDLGTVTQGDALNRTLVLKNTGESALAITTISATGATLTDDPSNTVITGLTQDTLTFNVSTATPGAVSGNISIPSSDADENPYVINFVGAVNALVPDVTVFDGATEITDGQATAIDIGSAVVGAAAPSKVFTVNNTGGADLTLSVTVPTGFNLKVAPVSPVTAGGNTTFEVEVPTTAEGSFSGDVEITTNVTGKETFSFAVSGAVTAAAVPNVTVFDGAAEITDGQTTAISIGSAEVGAAAPSKVFTVNNTGSADLTLSVTVPTGFNLKTAPVSPVTAGGNTTFEVELLTAAAGTPSGDVEITTNVAGKETFNFAISGTVTAIPVPNITVFDGATEITDGQTTAISIGAAEIGEAAPSKVFTINNTGTADLTVSVTVPTGFNLKAAPAATVASGGNTTFEVELPTTAEGSFSGDVEITTNVTGKETFNFVISGIISPESAATTWQQYE